MPADVNLNVNIDKKGDGDKQAAAGLEVLAKAADNAQDQLKQLDRQLLETRAAMVAAGKTFAETGDQSPLKALLKDERQLSTVQKSISRGAEAIAKDLTKAGEDGAKGFWSKFTNLGGTSFDSSQIPSLLATQGSLGGKAFGSGFTGALAPFAVPAALAFGVPLVAELGALIGGATLGAVGLGAIGAGLALQFNNAQVKASITGLGSYLKDQLKSSTSSFADQFVAGFTALRREIQPLWADLSRGFQALDPYVSNLLVRLGEGLAKLGPGLSRAMAAAGPIIGAISKNLPTLFNGISIFFDEIAKGGKGAAESIDVLIKAVSLTLVTVGGAVRVLAGAFDFLLQASDRVTGALASVWSAAAKIPGVGAAVKPIAAAFDELHASVHGSAVSFTESQLSANGASAAADHSGAAFRATATAALAAASAVGVMSQKYGDFIGKTLGVDEANLAANQSFNDLRDAVKQNGTALDQNSAKGIANERVVLAGVQAFEAQRQAAIDAAGGQNASASAVNAANAKYDQQVGALRTLAAHLFGSTSAVDSLIGAMYSIPNIQRTITINTVVTTAHKDIYLGNSGAYQQSASSLLGAGATGGIRSYAGGGIDNAGILAPSNPGTLLAAEPRTRGEALIPRSGISNDRGLQLADQAARWHGGRVVPDKGSGYGMPGGHGGLASARGNVAVNLTLSGDTGSGLDGLLATWFQKQLRTGGIKISSAQVR